MTRARAAAAASKPKTTSAASTTAASRAKAAATTATKTTAKRKTRADENDDGEDEVASAPAMKTARPRGRPRKADEPAEEPKPVRRAAATSAAGTAARATRATRAKKVEPAEEEPAKPKRGRPRKNTENEEPKNAPEPAKTRTRAATTTATKPVAKKTVTFQEPEKENINPDTKKEGEAKPAAGIRGRPVRRGAVAAAAAAPKTTTTTTAAPATRATRVARTTTTKTANKAPEKMPLSPKKATQVTARDRDPPSEDELAGPEKTPLKKKPLRPPPSSALAQSKASEATEEAPAEKAEEPEKEEEAAPADVLRSPAKRPPPTPFKDAIKSPAKRAEGFQLPSSPSKSAGQQPGATPKMSLLQSPAKKPQAGLSMAPPSLPGAEPVASTPLKSSLLGTPARRPGSVLRAFASARKEAAAVESPATKPTILSTPLEGAKPSEMLMDEEEAEGAAGVARNLFAEPMPSLKFPGRLSAVLPRDADPAYDLDMSTVEEGNENGGQLGGVQEAEVVEPVEVQAENEVLANGEEVEHPAEDEEETDVEVSDNEAENKEPASEDEDHEMSDILDEPEQVTDENNTEQPEEPTTAKSPPKSATKFSLRQKDLDPFHGLDEESDDEQTTTLPRNKSPSPTRSTATPSGPHRRVSTGRRASGLGFTPLADKLGAWKASSPKKSPLTRRQSAASVLSNEELAKQSFFDDEMSVREQNEINAAIMAALEADIDAQIDPVFDDIAFTAEDMELAEEAKELSMMEMEPMAQDPDDTLSEASQDYGDENQVPSEPTVSVPPQTPARPIQKTSHTVSKVPLKAADHSTPSPIKKRRHSVSKLPVQRPASVQRSATVISYSPTKSDKNPGTPSKDSWSVQGTPARTPRSDLQSGLLRGAVVFVDVRTSDGSDASEFFVELLSEMGARCVKRWDWAPEEESAPVGITHVVFKDGGKRTLEKVREAGGVVQCVGASWVLEYVHPFPFTPYSQVSVPRIIC